MGLNYDIFKERQMTVPESTTHFDYVNCKFYRLIENRTYKYNGFSWSEVFNVDLDNFMRL